MDFEKNVSSLWKKMTQKSDGRTSVRYYMRRGLAHVIGFRYFCQGINCFLMTKEELIDLLSKEEISEEQIVLACAHYDNYPEDFIWDVDDFSCQWKEEEEAITLNFEELRTAVCGIHISEVEKNLPVTAAAFTAVTRSVISSSSITPDELYASYSPLSMTMGTMVGYHIFPILQYAQSGMSLDTLLRIGVYVVCEAMGKCVYDMPKDVIIGCIVHALGLMYAAIDEPLGVVDKSKEVLGIASPEINTILDRVTAPMESAYDALLQIEDKFQTLTQENQRLERQLNRNKNISLAIRDLLMTRHDRDFQFRYKYQWIGVYEVMGEQHLLPDNSVATFCRLCNDPKGTSYFLPEVDDELQGTNLYIAGDCYEKKSTYHQMISHGKEDRQREVIDKTKEIFEIFLTQRGVLNKE